jgi:hypothetical protein
MRAPVQVNRHRPLAPDALTSWYRSARHAVRVDDLEDVGAVDWDDYYSYEAPDSRRDWTADDHLIGAAFEESAGLACEQPKIGHFLPSTLACRVSPPAPGEAGPSHPSDALGEALFAHVETIVARARARELVLDGDLAEALQRRNGGLRGGREVRAALRSHPGPVAMALLFTPFWVRPLASWPGLASEGGSLDVSSLVAHLFQIYPVPRALHQPWLGAKMPELKWVVWLILLGQGGNLHHAARRFGWTVAKRFTHAFAAAPHDLAPVEAAMWAEVARAGGDRRDFDRIRGCRAYVIDPTAGPDSVPPRGPVEDDEAWEAEEALDRLRAAAAMRAFWREAVAWLVRHRDELTDEGSGAILEWALHLHTESRRITYYRVPPPFRWAGREPGPALEAAEEYVRRRYLPYGDLTWKHHGLDWETGEGEHPAWTVRELTTSRALAEESRAMHHCVSSYARRCADGYSMIFSLCAAGERRITIELASWGDVLQARGTCNRDATAEERAVMNRWLAAIAVRRAAR